MKKSHYILLLTTLLISSCKSKIVEYDNQSKLESYIKSVANYNITDKQNDFLIIILQNEDCICTEPDMQLSTDLLESKKYSFFKKILIVNKKGHRVFKKLSERTLKDITVIYNENNTLLKAGYIAMTDRIILYQSGNSSYYVDLHVKKPASAKSELL